jgi:hypothetical protein
LFTKTRSFTSSSYNHFLMHPVRSLLSLFFVLAISATVSAQFRFEYNDSIGARISNDTLKMPWAGGLNYVQFSDIDYDFDGDKDLFIFDRSKDNIRLFETVTVNGMPQYRFVHNGARFFPEGLHYRVALVDYDGDGRPDIFTYGIGGVKVYKNTGDLTNGLQWQLISNLLYSDYVGSYTNLYVSSSDIPAYVDVDADSDLDILTFNIGGQRVEYHQNQSFEIYGHADSLIFVLKNECWGKFKEDPNNNAVVLNDNTSPCSVGSIPTPLRPAGMERIPDSEIPATVTDSVTTLTRHAGSTLLAIDIDSSGVLDLILGDVAHNNLNLLINGGTAPNTNSAMISQDYDFPSNTTPVDITLFPASFYVDVDHDSIKDLIVGANARGVSQNEKSVLYYKNLGTNALPNFIYKSKNFLQGEMLENGTGSIPVFFDQNNDGAEDLILANFYRYKEVQAKESALAHYRNTGTSTIPYFSFIDQNYLSIPSQNYGLRSVPTFGDIDGDGDKDLFLGLENGTLAYYQNTAAPNAPAAFGPPVLSYTDHLGQVITANSYCFPQLFDLNADGLLDLLLGRKTGEIVYYENTGTLTSPAFTLVTSLLGGVDLSATTSDVYAAPHFFRHQDTTYLFLGGNDGKLHFYDAIDGNLADGDTFHLVSPAYLGIDVEGYSAFWVNDIDHDGRLNLFVGGDLGGIMHFEHDPNSTAALPENTMHTNISVFPNPSEGTFQVALDVTEPADWAIEVYDALGRSILQQAIDAPLSTVDLQGSAQGIYHLVIRHLKTGQIESRKLVKGK